MANVLAKGKFNKSERDENIVQLFLGNSLLFFKNFHFEFCKITLRNFAEVVKFPFISIAKIQIWVNL
jgi:hypothetical protein